MMHTDSLLSLRSSRYVSWYGYVLLALGTTALAGAADAADTAARRNVIVMISDGCGFNQVAAASLYAQGTPEQPGAEQFPVQLAMSTYCQGQSYDPNLAWKTFDYVLHEATDSAAAATAMSTGHKTYAGAIGVDAEHKPLRHVLEQAEQQGLSTGVVTTVQFVHATPAGFSAHNDSRGHYEQIAHEMICQSPLEVIMGCGHPLYNAQGAQAFNKDTNGDGQPDAYDYRLVGGETLWQDLADGAVAGADADQDGDRDLDDYWTVIQTRQDFQNLAQGPTPPRVIGIPQVHATLQFQRPGNRHDAPFTADLLSTVPRLDEMTRAALNVLDDNPRGFFLMIEGGAIDWAGHGNQLGGLIEEQLDFVHAVAAVINWVEQHSNWDETLLIVTADHETGYLTGPDSGAADEGPRWNSLVNNGKGQLPGVAWHTGGHSNSLVPFYAKGREASLAPLQRDCGPGPCPRPLYRQHRSGPAGLPLP